MQEKQKKRVKLPHWLPFVLSLIGVGALMLLYIFFIGSWLGTSVPPTEKLVEFSEYISGVKDDLTALAELDNAKIGADDSNAYFISRNGDEQALRDRVFEGAYSGESYMSEATGTRCARFYYTWYDLECIVICDKGSASKHIDGTDYSVAVDDNIAAAIRGNEIG
jgi:hypothetical protein